jgi:hypothetical protein
VKSDIEKSEQKILAKLSAWSLSALLGWVEHQSAVSGTRVGQLYHSNIFADSKVGQYRGRVLRELSAWIVPVD